jgi:hypothetical protein
MTRVAEQGSPFFIAKQAGHRNSVPVTDLPERRLVEVGPHTVEKERHTIRLVRSGWNYLTL